MKDKEKKQKEAIIQDFWDTVYNANGFTLSDFWNHFLNCDDFLASQHGERFYEVVENEYGEKILDEIEVDYSYWRQNVSYYFDNFVSEWKKNRFPINRDLMVEVFMFYLVKIQVYNHNDIEIKPPKKIEKFCVFLFS